MQTSDLSVRETRSELAPASSQRGDEQDRSTLGRGCRYCPWPDLRIAPRRLSVGIAPQNFIRGTLIALLDEYQSTMY